MISEQNNLSARADRLTQLLTSAKSRQEVEQVLNEELPRRRRREDEDDQSPVGPGRKAGARHDQPKDIGIWKPVLESGQVAFVRPPNSDPWRLWAAVDHIKPKGNKFRIVLLGESVARGFFLDPDFNCALALQTILESATGRQDIEIVDLARNSLNFSELKELLEPTLAVDPDAYVIFAGNNWSPNCIEGVMDFDQAGELLRRKGSWAVVRNYAEELAREQVYLLVEFLGNMSKERSIPVVFIIPEFNLQDWEVNHGWQNPLVGGDLARQQSRLKAEAESALAIGNLNLAADLAERLIEIGEGAAPMGFDILASCRIIQGNIAEAREYKEKAIDSIQTFNTGISRCPTALQEALRQHGEAQGLLMVDLPLIFRESFPTELPGRKYFFDFCHMTADGLWMAMACAAEKILPLLGEPARAWHEIECYRQPVNRQVTAKAHLGAAIVSAYLGQSYQAIYYHCSEALRQSPESYDLMRVVIECHLRRSHDIEHVNRLGDYSMEPRLALRGMNPAVAYNAGNDLYPLLVQAVTDVLSTSHLEIARDLADLLIEEHRVTEYGSNLLSRAYLDITSSQLEYLWELDQAFLKSYQAETRFRLVSQADEATSVSFTCRVPGEEEFDREAKLSVNGTVIQTFRVNSRWQKWTVIIPGELLYRGINSLVLSWPDPVIKREQRVQEVAAALESFPLTRRIKDLYQVYGEVYEFKAFQRLESQTRSQSPLNIPFVVAPHSTSNIR